MTYKPKLVTVKVDTRTMINSSLYGFVPVDNHYESVCRDASNSIIILTYTDKSSEVLIFIMINSKGPGTFKSIPVLYVSLAGHSGIKCYDCTSSLIYTPTSLHSTKQSLEVKAWPAHVTQSLLSRDVLVIR